MTEQYLLEMEYKNYLAYVEMVESLQELSSQYNVFLDEASLEALNELSVGAVGVWINKVVSNIQDAWNNFKSGVKNSMWESFKKINEEYFDEDLDMEVPSGTTIPILAHVRSLVKEAYPEYKKDLHLKEENEFYQYHMKSFYEKDKSPEDVMEAKCFENLKGAIVIKNGEGDMKRYIEFMDDFEEIYDAISKDLNTINKSAKQIKVDAERKKKDQEEAKRKAEEEAKKKEEEERKAKLERDVNSKKEEEKKQPEKEGEVVIGKADEAGYINLAAYLLESVLMEDEGFKDVTDGKDDDKDDNKEGSDDKEDPVTDEEIEGIQTYWNCVAKVLKAKLTMVTKARTSSQSLIKNFCALVKKSRKEEKKELKDAGK